MSSIKVCHGTSATLIQSMNGGETLVYKCDECGAILYRTPEDAERQAIKIN